MLSQQISILTAVSQGTTIFLVVLFHLKLTFICLPYLQIDGEVILLMEDAQLANYLPSYGDLIALFNFCKRQTQSSKRKQGLFEKLRDKLQFRNKNYTVEEEPQTSQRNKRHRAKTSTRIIEIGWVHSEGKITKQVRAKQGGGDNKDLN